MFQQFRNLEAYHARPGGAKARKLSKYSSLPGVSRAAVLMLRIVRLAPGFAGGLLYRDARWLEFLRERGIPRQSRGLIGTVDARRYMPRPLF